MFASNFFGRFAKFYPYPFSRVKFLLPLNCKSSLRKFATKRSAAISYGHRISPRNRANTPDHRQSYNTNPSKKMPPRNYSEEYNYTITNAGKTKTGSFFSGQNSTYEGFREFFTHPLTWDRNNGYLNILLALAIFGYSFCSTCHPDIDDKRK